MANIVLCYPNRADSATLSGGSWNGTLVLNNLKDPDIDNVARSTSNAASSTRFLVDLGANYAVRAVALINHTVGVSDTWRVKANTSAQGALTLGSGSGGTYDSGSVAARQITFQGDTPSDWGAKYMLLATLNATVRYFAVELACAAAIDLGRLFIGGGFQPEYNARQDDMADDLDELSTRQTTPRGKEYLVEVSRRRRGQSIYLPALSTTEAQYLREIQHEAGIVDEVLYIPDPDDLAKSQFSGFLGRFERLDPIRYAMYLRRGLPLALREKL
jgi:hypothetical protein